MLLESQRIHCLHRLLGFDLVRSNPDICGFNITGMLDHGMTGEGLWTFWREWKPGIVDALRDGWAPLRFCIFAEPQHIYSGEKIKLEAALANEDVLSPGEYPVNLKVRGPEGIAWEHRAAVKIPEPGPGKYGPLAVPVFSGEIKINGPAGAYKFAASMEQGCAPAGGTLEFYVSENPPRLRLKHRVAQWGIGNNILSWLRLHGAHSGSFTDLPEKRSRVILVGDIAGEKDIEKTWQELTERIKAGSAAIFLSPAAFKSGEDSVTRLPLKNKGVCRELYDSLYHIECVAKPHPMLEGLQPAGIMDWYFYGPVIPHLFFEGTEVPDDVIAAAFTTGYPIPGGYASGILAGSYKLGKGNFIINTFKILENIGSHPAADRLLLNLVSYASKLIKN
jgi:hypothetical protein